MNFLHMTIFFQNSKYEVKSGLTLILRTRVEFEGNLIIIWKK